MAAWTVTPRTWTVGEVVTAANMNVQLRDFASSFGALGSYTPTLGGFTAGNGIATGRYMQTQKMVFFEAQFVFGTTSAAAAAIPTLSLPVTAATALSYPGAHQAIYVKTGTAGYAATAYRVNSNAVGIVIIGASGIFTTPSTTLPFTWAANDFIRVSGWYEAP